jgi:hypothetical protein
MTKVVLVEVHNYYYVKPEDDIILVDASHMGDITITLPMTDVDNGKIFKIKNIRNTQQSTHIKIVSDTVYFDYMYPTISLPGASSCELLYYNNCYYVLSIQSM